MKAHMCAKSAKPEDTACHCPACSPSPRATYTDEFKLDCQARLYGNFSAKHTERFLEALQRQPDWEKHHQTILDRLEKLKQEERFKTGFWQKKSLEQPDK